MNRTSPRRSPSSPRAYRRSPGSGRSSGVAAVLYRAVDEREAHARERARQLYAENEAVVPLDDILGVPGYVRPLLHITLAVEVGGHKHARVALPVIQRPEALRVPDDYAQLELVFDRCWQLLRGTRQLRQGLGRDTTAEDKSSKMAA